MADFDFSSAVELFKPYLDKDDPAYNADVDYETINAICMSLPLFEQYAAHYLSRDYSTDVKKTLRKAALPSTDPVKVNVESVYTTFSSAVSPAKNRTREFGEGVGEYSRKRGVLLPARPVRKSHVYAMTHDETEIAIDFLEQNPDFLYGMIDLRDMLQGYFHEWYKAVDKAYSLSNMLTSNSNKLINRILGDHMYGNAKGLSLTHDLTPIIAHYLSSQEDPFQPVNIRKGIRDAFTRQAFESYHTGSGYKKCAFAHPLMRIFSLGFEKGVDGALTPVQTKDPATLILFMRNFVRENLFTSLRPK